MQFQMFVNAKLKVDETFITDNRIARKNKKLLPILQDLQQNSSSEINSSSKRIGGYFCSDTVFNLSSKVLTNTEINILEKG